MRLNYGGLRLAGELERRLYSVAIDAYSMARADGGTTREAFAAAEAATKRLRGATTDASPRQGLSLEDNDA